LKCLQQRAREKGELEEEKKISANRSSSAGSSTTPTATTTSTTSTNKRKEAPVNCADPKEGKKRVNYSRTTSTQKFIEFFTQLEHLPSDKLYKVIAAVRTKLEASKAQFESSTSDLCDIITIDSEDEEQEAPPATTPTSEKPEIFENFPVTTVPVEELIPLEEDCFKRQKNRDTERNHAAAKVAKSRAVNKVVDAVLDVSLTEPQQALCLKHVLKHPRLGRHCQSIGLSTITDAQLFRGVCYMKINPKTYRPGHQRLHLQLCQTL